MLDLTRDSNRDGDYYIMENLKNLFFTRCLMDIKVKKNKWVGVTSSKN